MKTTVISLLTLVTVGTALPAFAGPDWHLIEQARKAKQAAVQLAVRDNAASSGVKGCPAPPLVLPLDHGPRSQTTPAMNEKRRQQYEAGKQACGTRN